MINDTQSVAMIIATLLTLIPGDVSMAASPPATGDADANATTIAIGKELAFDRVKGNCLACHQIEGGDMAGNIGPPLVNMRMRYPDVAKLRAQIWDAAVANPNTAMPPVGRHRMLTEQELDQVVTFIWSK